MNTLYIHNGCVNFIGFDELISKAYFSFRNGGLAISGGKMDIANQKEFILSDRQISDEHLSELLILFGFLNINSFSKDKNGIYFCKFPDVPSVSREDLLKSKGLESLLEKLDCYSIKGA